MTAQSRNQKSENQKSCVSTKLGLVEIDDSLAVYV